jgi:hypothetical protein
MRTNTLWVASLAMLSSPLLISVEAAPRPDNGHQRRYQVPVRRQLGLGPLLNDSPISIPISIPSIPTPSTDPVAGLASSILDGGNDPQPTSSDPAPFSKTTDSPDLLGGLLPSVVPVVQSILSDAGGDVNSIISDVPSIVGSIPTVVPAIISDVNSVVSSLPTVVPDIISDVNSVVSAVVSDAGSVAGTLPTVIPAIISDVNSVVSSLPTVVPDIISDVNSVVSAVVSDAGSVAGSLPTVIPVIVSDVNSVVSAVVSDAGSVAGSLPTVIPVIVSDVNSVVSAVVSDVGSVAGSLPTVLPVIVSDVNSVVSAVVSDVGSVAGSLPTVVPEIISDVGSVAGSLPTVVSAIISDVGTVVGSIPTIVPAVISDVNSVVSAVVSDVGSVAGSIPTIVPAVISDVNSVVSAVISDAGSLPTIVPAVISDVGSVLSSVVGTIPTEVPVIVSQAISVVGSLPTGSGLPVIISQAISDALPSAIPSDPVVSIPIVASALSAGISAPAVPTGIFPSSLPAVLPSSMPAIPAIPAASVSAISAANPDPSLLPLTSAGIIVPVSSEGSVPTAPAVPSNILINSSPSAVVPLATNAPLVIQPAGGIPAKQPGQTLIQVGFNKSLSYPFVAGNTVSASQIFSFLPEGIADGLGLNLNQVVMQSIQPYDTLKNLGYVTTLALVYVPTSEVSTLSILMQTPTSAIYEGHPSDSVNAFMAFINPSIPLLAGQTMGEGSAGAAPATYSTVSGSQAGGAPIGGDAGNVNPVQGSSVAIAGPMAGAGAAFALAMVFVARRYAAKRRSLYGSSEVSSSDNPVWMSPQTTDRTSTNSPTNRSIRSQDISHPVMAQNSLGWN